jgi:hypothetical protein
MHGCVISVTYFTSKGMAKVLGASTITSSVKTAAKAIGLEKNGFPMTSVSSHSLRAGGAMAMHLNNVPHDTIRKAGHWSSDTFLMYIHEQIAAFSKGISKQMLTEIEWQNIEGPWLTILQQQQQQHNKLAHNTSHTIHCMHVTATFPRSYQMK